MAVESTRDMLMQLDKEQLVDLLEIRSKSFVALDGVWFQSVEGIEGMGPAIMHDAQAWERFTNIEAHRIKKFLNLDEQPGLDGLQQALCYRFYADLNEYEFERPDENTLIYTMRDCRVQNARTRKDMGLHPCKPVGIIEYAGFARTIDDRIACECLSCYPDVTDEACACKWKFTLE